VSCKLVLVEVIELVVASVWYQRQEVWVTAGEESWKKQSRRWIFKAAVWRRGRDGNCESSAVYCWSMGESADNKAQ
jgi:hypothetical protein